MTSAPIDPLIGHTLDERYLIRSRIARGGMAMVYLATDLRLERKVAVKVMHEHLAEDENFTRRFDREARSAARLSHANLVNVFDQGHDLGRTYLVMEYLPGITLRELLKQQKRLTLEQSLEIAEAILSGLAAAHSAGIVHRDLKPENVLLVDDGRIKIGDFGLARAVSANTTTGQALLGTIAYLSPELVTRGIADERSDIYAFGIMLYEMLTGVQPFTGEQPMQIAYQHANSDVPAPSEKSSVSTAAVDEFVQWTTRRDAALRPADASEALEQLHELMRDPYVAAAPPTVTSATTVLPSATTVLPEQTAATTHLTPSTGVLGGPIGVPQSSAATTSGATAGAAIERARDRGKRRARRGKIIAVVVTLLLIATGAVAYAFGQGPWSRVVVPNVTGIPATAAADELAALELTTKITECNSVDVEKGAVVETTPGAGARLDRGSTVTLCSSIGPKMLPVPTIAGLTLDAAEQAIAKARFTFGEVIDTRFSDSDKDVVLAALDDNDEGLGETYPEQGVVNLIVSAGPLPDVSSQSVEEATQTLDSHQLSVNGDLNTEEYNEDIPKGDVIALIPGADLVRPGDAVGLRISLGPELFEVPDVADMALKDAIDTLTNAGFTPSWNPIFDAPGLAKAAIATGTDPEAGAQVPHGTEIYIKASIFG